MKLQEYIDAIKGSRTVVIGAGISNTPLIDLLLDNGIPTEVHDKSTRENLGETAQRFERKGAVLKLNEEYLKNLNADIIFRTPGLMPSEPALCHAVEAGAVLTSEMELFFEVCPCKIIGVTGSDGKTTTTSLIAEILKKEGHAVHIGGNIGCPLLCEADSMTPQDFAVIELSSFQLITMKKCPSISVVTNVTPNHLDKHTNMAEYIESKRNIFSRQESGTRAIFNLDNKITREFSETASGEVLLFSRREEVQNGFFFKDNTIFQSVNGSTTAIMDTKDIFLPGVHNIENIMAAFAAVSGLTTMDNMIQTAREFKGVAHRIEFVDEIHGVRFYNDSMASSPTRTIAGLRSFDRKVILIAGGQDKGVPFTELGSEIIARVKTLVLTGATTNAIIKSVVTAPEYNGSPSIIISKDLKEAVHASMSAASKGDTIIMSPAGTSFDRYKNYEERGNLFREIVKGLN